MEYDEETGTYTFNGPSQGFEDAEHKIARLERHVQILQAEIDSLRLEVDSESNA